MKSARNILVLTADSLSDRMAGPAIRAFEIAKALAPSATVRLGSTTHADLEHPSLEVSDFSRGGLRSAVGWADVIVFQGHILHSHPWIGETDKILVADIYDPLHLEQLEQVRDYPFEERVALSAGIVDVLNQQIMRADFMVCASEKQRDFWLGQLAGLGRINPATYDADSSLRKLLDVVPFGVADEVPRQTRHALRDTVEGIGFEDKVIVWGGGIYNWFDPLTLIRAVASLSARQPRVKLYFLGIKHPNPHVPEMEMSRAAQTLAASLGVLDRSVFFNHDWVPYGDRVNYLLDADLGVSTHLEHLETAFSFRTRILDYLWCGLPVVATQGDTFADLIEAHSLGAVIGYQDAEGLERALEQLLFDDAVHAEAANNVREFAETMRWGRVLTPLTTFCLDGERASDLASGVRFAALATIAGLQARIDGLESSSSWKITAPFRRAARFFGRDRV